MVKENFFLKRNNEEKNGIENIEDKDGLESLRKNALDIVKNPEFLERINNSSGSKWIKRVTFLAMFLAGSSVFGQEVKESIENVKESVKKIMLFVNNNPDKVITIGQDVYDEKGIADVSLDKYPIEIKEKVIGEYRVCTGRNGVFICKTIEKPNGEKMTYVFLDSKSKMHKDQYKIEYDTSKVDLGQADGIVVIPGTITDEELISMLSFGKDDALLGDKEMFKKQMEELSGKQDSVLKSSAFNNRWVILHSNKEVEEFYRVNYGNKTIVEQTNNQSEKIQSIYETYVMEVDSLVN